MLGAVEDVVTQTAPGCLKVVRIIIFQQAMVKDFHSRMEKKAGHNTSFLGKLKGKQLLSPKYALKQGSATYGTRVMAGTQRPRRAVISLNRVSPCPSPGTWSLTV